MIGVSNFAIAVNNFATRGVDPHLAAPAEASFALTSGLAEGNDYNFSSMKKVSQQAMTLSPPA